MAWLVDDSVQAKTGDIHIIPLEDLRPHESSRTCWCQPEEDVEGWDVFNHRSLDGRERHEEGAPLH